MYRSVPHLPRWAAAAKPPSPDALARQPEGFTLAWLAGIYGIVFGVVMLVEGLQLRGAVRRQESAA